MWPYASSTSTGSNIGIISKLPWRTWQWSIHPVLLRVAGNHYVWAFGDTHGWIPVIGWLAQATQMSCSDVSSHPESVVPWSGLYLFESQWTRFDDQVAVQSIQQALSALWMSVSELSKYLQICTFSIIFAKPGLMADTLLIRALPSFRSLPIFPMSMLSFSPNCWSRSWASQDLVQPFTPRLLMNAPKASCMTCAMHGMWFPNAGHLIPEALSVDCRLQVIES